MRATQRSPMRPRRRPRWSPRCHFTAMSAALKSLRGLSAAAAEEPTLKFPNYYRAYTAMVQRTGREFDVVDGARSRQRAPIG